MKIYLDMCCLKRPFDAPSIAVAWAETLDLVKELGYSDAVRFLWQYESGRGDYTEERESLLAGWTIEDITRDSETLLERKRSERETGGA